MRRRRLPELRRRRHQVGISLRHRRQTAVLLKTAPETRTSSTSQ
jgi:hypothetical protein